MKGRAGPEKTLMIHSGDWILKTRGWAGIKQQGIDLIQLVSGHPAAEGGLGIGRSQERYRDLLGVCCKNSSKRKESGGKLGPSLGARLRLQL